MIEEKIIPKFSLNKHLTSVNISGIILTIIGILFLFIPEYINLKTSFTIIFIGCFLFVMISEKGILKRIKSVIINRNIDPWKKNNILLSEKITIIIIIWTLFLYFITKDSDIEILFVLVFLGLLVIKVLTDEFTTNQLKKKMYLFIIPFLTIFVIIIAEKILTF